MQASKDELPAPGGERKLVSPAFRQDSDGLHPLTPDELGDLAKQMVEAQDAGKAKQLLAQIVRGFYGRAS